MNTPKPINAKKTVVLYFIAGIVPSAEDKAIAERIRSLRVRVCFRNASQVQPDESLEKCDYVAGSVPAVYSHIEVYPLSQPEAPVLPEPVQQAPAAALEPAVAQASEPIVAEQVATQPEPASPPKGKRQKAK